MNPDDDFDRVFGARPIQGAFTERLMATAEAKGYVKASPAALSAPDETLVGSTDYKPYGFRRDAAGESCDLRLWGATGTAEGLLIQYRFLLSIGYVGEERMRLRLPDAIVEIEGRKLGALRQAIARRQVSFIQQYSPRLWLRPPANETLVERIEIVRPDLVTGTS